MRQDFHYALRIARRHPGTSIATVLTLAIGIGAGTAIFTAVDRLLLRPLPYPDPARLVFVERAPLRFGPGVYGAIDPSFRQLPVFAALGTWAPGGMNLDDGDGLRLAAAVVDDGFFETIGIAPLLGRPLPAPDGTSRFVVLSYDLWRTRFSADRSVVGGSVTLNSQAYTIAGVMPPGFGFPGRTQVWIPPRVDLQATGTAYAPEVIARIGPGTSVEQARQAVQAYEQAVNARRGATPSPDDSIVITPLGAELTRQSRPTLLLLSGSVALLLLVICASVANILLARVAARRQEFVVRLALGAARWRIARQLLIESLILSLAGGALGALAATWALRSLRVLAPATLDEFGFGVVDGAFLALAIGVSVLTAAIFGIAPGLAAASHQAEQVVRVGHEDSGWPVWRRLRSGLIVGQMAIALALLAGSAASVAALLEAARIDPGFGSPRALAMTVTLPLARFGSSPTVAAFFERAHERLKAVPGVRRVGGTGFLPGSRETGAGMAINVKGRPAPAPEDRVYATYLPASPDYFTVAGIRVVAGRAFSAGDRAGAARVAVLSESTARRLFPDGASPIGQAVEISSGPRAAAVHEIVGVVADVRLRSLTATGRSLQQIYVPLLQNPPFGNLSFVAEVDGEPTAVAASLRAAMRALDSSIPVYNLHALDSVVDRYLAAHRLAGTLVSGFAVVTLLVAAIGLYGLMAQLVAQRRRELGIRVALGADPRALRCRIVFHGAAHALFGSAVGAAGAFTAMRALGAILPALADVSLWVHAANAAVLLAVAIAATWFPASRVVSVDPMRALRE